MMACEGVEGGATARTQTVTPFDWDGGIGGSGVAAGRMHAGEFVPDEMYYGIKNTDDAKQLGAIQSMPGSLQDLSCGGHRYNLDDLD
ncbi:Aste57867_11353 [Aphanomyces stellatus]|uniref:Aste57867_11353 protein n=1 Tax=Aphanomyces stellatus TaxID=120398 RepID=A0A485KSQ7_9STRA|nr:hypothetical protein As57867_011311 [Aphanomyces stellatus]VFT88215.1 Aste57867_11353 [Aphanomyces stellatus]